jgi:hypothetical protein
MAVDFLKVIIIGAGLAGPLLANGLLNKSNAHTAPVTVTVYERDPPSSNPTATPTPTSTPTQTAQTRGGTGRGRKGFQIRLGAPALAGFKACLTPTQLHAILSHFGKVASAAPALFDRDFKLLADMGRFEAYTRSAPVERGVLRGLLCTPLEGRGLVRFGRRLVGYEIVRFYGHFKGSSSRGGGRGGREGETKVRVYFEDGSSD